MSTTDSSLEFDADLAYLQGLSDFMFDTAGHQLPYTSGSTIYDRLLADLTSGARHALSPHGWTIDVNWDMEVAA